MDKNEQQIKNFILKFEYRCGSRKMIIEFQMQK
jgi:hypothetical protein